MRTPSGLAIDGSGNLYVAVGDSFNFTNDLRKVDPAGTVTNVVDAFHFPNGLPGGLTVDAAGKVYLAEYVGFLGSSALSRVDPAGTATRLLVSWLPYSDPGDVNKYELVFATGVAVDRIGNVYAASRGQHRVVRVGPGGAWPESGSRSDERRQRHSTVRNVVVAAPCRRPRCPFLNPTALARGRYRSDGSCLASAIASSTPIRRPSAHAAAKASSPRLARSTAASRS